MFVQRLTALCKPLLLLLLCGTLGCKNQDSTTTTRAEEDLAQFRAWLNNKTDGNDSTSAENWAEVKEGFQEKTAKLDSKLDSLSAESKAEYKELRQKYQNWEARNQQRAAVPLHSETLERFELELLGSATTLDSTWKAAGVRPMYTQFMQNVQARRASWSASDWDYATEIYEQLNRKKDPLEGSIPAEDKVKIKALQAEFLALETARDAKDLFNEVR